MKKLLNEIRSCTVCSGHLPYKPRPIVQAATNSSIVIIGQAPGLKVNTTGIPWDDASGNELRRWLGVTKEQFYDSSLFALIPMGFCYPGKGTSGDLPPRPECAPLWHNKLIAGMQNKKLTLLIGVYAQKYYLADNFSTSLTENVRKYHEFLPEFLPLVHPSPRNKIWQKKNPWFESEVIPVLQKVVQGVLMPR